MTFLLKKDDALKTTRTKPTRVAIFAIVAAAAAVVSVGYIMALAILAPQQLAEATAAASDLVCSGCVGTSDIADSAVTSAKIGSGQVANSDIATNAVGSAKILNGEVGNSDIATNAVTSTKIGSGQVANSDLGTSAVTSSKISDTAGVQSVDIVNGQVGSVDIGDGQVTTEDIANDAIQPNVHSVQSTKSVAAGTAAQAFAHCPTGETVTGGGFVIEDEILIDRDFPYDADTWSVQGVNIGSDSEPLTVYAICIGPSP